MPGKLEMPKVTPTGDTNAEDIGEEINPEEGQVTDDEPLTPEDTEGGEETPEVPAVNVEALDQAIATAQAEVDAVQGTFADAAGDLTKMLEFAEAIKRAKASLDRANANKASALYDLLATERVEFSTDLREQVHEFIAPFEDRARELSLTSVHVTFGPDGGIQVSVMDSSRPVAKRSVSRTPSAGNGTSADGKNRNAWTMPDGSTYSSQQLLLKYGDEISPGFGELAVDRAHNWKEPKWGPNGNEPMKSGPGFNAEVTKLAAKIGATR
jgi:hypothetical protein